MTHSGRVLAQVLEGSWRCEPPPLRISAPLLARAAPLLVGSGAGALAWRRLRGASEREMAGAEALRQAHVQQALDTQLQERKIEALLRKLRAHGVEPLLIKGWAVARVYPEPGLRPLGDLDLVVRPRDARVTESVLGVRVDDETQEASFADVKTSLRSMYRMSLEAAFGGARRVSVRGESVLILGPEDHLRLLCLHFLRHGAWRPLSLCDIAVALEARPTDFDWDRCLGSDRRCADYVACALGLAHQLLHARIEDTPVQKRARSLPPWLMPQVLRAWATPMTGQHLPPPLIAEVPRRPGSLLRALRLRWPGPIEAAVAGHFPLDIHPLPAQILLYGVACGRFLWRTRSRQRRGPAS